jgi:ribosomal protein S26
MAAFYPYDGGYDGWGSPSVRCNNCGKVMPVDDIVDAWAKK